MKAYVIKNKNGKYYDHFTEYGEINTAMLFSNNDIALKDGESLIEVEIHEIKQKGRFKQYGKYTHDRYRKAKAAI